MTKLTHILALILLTAISLGQSDPSPLKDNPVDIVNGR